MTPSLEVIRAAAGSGKTTLLACRYLRFLSDGIPAESAIAITFTRKAAAELKQRVSLSLRGCLDDAGGELARQRLGSVWSTLRQAAPQDPQLVRAALAALPQAPIGTTDAFVQQLLTEFALDATLPLPDGRRLPLDLPLTTGAGVQQALARTARRLLDPPVGEPDPDVGLLSRYVPLDALLAQVGRRTDLDALPLVSAASVFGRVAQQAARVLRSLDLVAVFGAQPPLDEESWARTLARITPKETAWATPEVARWLAEDALPERAPLALCGWLQGLPGTGRRAELRRALEATRCALGPAELPLWQVLHTLRFPYEPPEALVLADTLRAARDRLRSRVVAQALESAALSGELGYEELLDTAIALCESPPERLHERFCALLVDEVQDADPRQMRLYLAMARLPSVRSFFVGDPRQSIYLFRGAEPDGLRALGPGSRELQINRRSAPRLVEAHRALFGALAPLLGRLGLRPLEDLGHLQGDPDNAALAISGEPVWIVTPAARARPSDDELDEHALHTFVRRLALARAEPGHQGDTAAVLAPTWAQAALACRKIREWAGSSAAAFVEGSPGQLAGRVADDLRLLLRALLDRGDDAAWLGVWKHPSLGLSDAALARLVGAGVRLGWALEQGELPAPHEPVDQLVFARGRPPLRRALARIGRTSTSQLLDELTDELGWRTTLCAGPGGDDEVAELEVLLDWMREHDSQGQTAEALLALLDSDRSERPQVHLQRPAGHVACTTVFQAKGLAWDHVCTLRPGRHARREPTREHEDGWIELDGVRLRLEGLRFDPRGGLLAFHDPLGRLAARLHAVRYTEEAARLLYVALTRARRSVTLALPAPLRSIPREPRLEQLLAQAWLTAPLPGVAQVTPAPERPSASPQTGWARPTGAPLPPRPALAAPWPELTPGLLVALTDGPARSQHLQRALTAIELADGLHLTSGRPVALPELDGLRPAHWRALVTGWLSAWRLQGTPSPGAAEGYLQRRWGGAPREVADVLLAISERLASEGGPLWTQATSPGARLHFEMPLSGLVPGEVLLSGQLDLWMELPDGRRWLVAFEPGESPTGWSSLAQSPSLPAHAVQLHAWADALRRAGRPPDRVATWFVCTGASIAWVP
jgi:ATP-dependent helicase/nuclease subunit A